MYINTSCTPGKHESQTEVSKELNCLHS